MLVNTLCIHNQVQNRDGDWYQNSINPWTQTWPNKYSLDCPSSRSWNEMDPGRVKCAIFSLNLCNCGLIKSPLLWMSSSWWDRENNTIYDLSSNHCFAYREETALQKPPVLTLDFNGCKSALHRWRTSGLRHACQKLFQVSHWKWVYGHSFHCGHGRMKILFFFSLYFLSSSGTHSLPPPHFFRAALQTSNSIPRQLNRQQLHQANSIENTAQQRLLNKLEQPLLKQPWKHTHAHKYFSLYSIKFH